MVTLATLQLTFLLLRDRQIASPTQRDRNKIEYDLTDQVREPTVDRAVHDRMTYTCDDYLEWDEEIG